MGQKPTPVTVSTVEESTRSMEVMQDYPHCELEGRTDDGVDYQLAKRNVVDAFSRLVELESMQEVEVVFDE